MSAETVGPTSSFEPLEKKLRESPELARFGMRLVTILDRHAPQKEMKEAVLQNVREAFNKAIKDYPNSDRCIIEGLALGNLKYPSDWSKEKKEALKSDISVLMNDSKYSDAMLTVRKIVSASAGLLSGYGGWKYGAGLVAGAYILDKFTDSCGFSFNDSVKTIPQILSGHMANQTEGYILKGLCSFVSNKFFSKIFGLFTN